MQRSTRLTSQGQKHAIDQRWGGGGGGWREIVTARLLTNCSNTLGNIHTNARDIKRTRAKRKAGHFLVAHPAFLFLP